MEFRQAGRPSVCLTRDQVLGQGEGFLEGSHNFIQVLFPLDEPSNHVDDAPVLTRDQILRIPAESLLKCLATMQSFFQYKHESGGWTQHNNLRVSRILKCLVLQGLQREASGFYHFMAHLREGHADSVRRWREATEAAPSEPSRFRGHFTPRRQCSHIHTYVCAVPDDAGRACAWRGRRRRRGAGRRDGWCGCVGLSASTSSPGC